MTRKILTIIMIIGTIVLCFSLSCGKESQLGGCSVSCGGFGTGQPFRQTNYRFINEPDCKQKGMEASGGCKASYCPPTGDDNDCYQVWPE